MFTRAANALDMGENICKWIDYKLKNCKTVILTLTVKASKSPAANGEGGWRTFSQFHVLNVTTSSLQASDTMQDRLFAATVGMSTSQVRQQDWRTSFLNSCMLSTCTDLLQGKGGRSRGSKHLRPLWKQNPFSCPRENWSPSRFTLQNKQKMHSSSFLPV